MIETKKIGDYGEIIAIKYLQSIGIKIIKTNQKEKSLEIDIIGEDESRVIFFEVKYRSSNKFGTPEEYLTKSKKKKILDAIYSYCINNSINIEDIQFDFISISKIKSVNRIKHYKNISLG